MKGREGRGGASRQDGGKGRGGRKVKEERGGEGQGSGVL